MENLFQKDMQEIKFFCSSNNTNTSTHLNICRRADILLSNNRTCEIQHSYISDNEIIKRYNDWNLFGKEIIWLVDGNDGIEINKLSSNNYLIIFKQVWKYKSFIKTYDYILLEVDNKVFKIELNKIKSGMIELKTPKSLQETIDYLKTKPDKIWDFWSDDNVIKSTLCIYQEGAGNGKTYGIWKSIIENIDRKTYIIITKQHTAKVVIYEELINQKLRFQNGEELFHIENLTDNSEENTEKHYVIKFIHKQSLRECKVIIGTIDSFCYNLSHSNAKGSEYFKGIVDNIVVKGATKMKNGYMSFGGQYIQLSKESELWIDEVQDLQVNYLEAMCKLMYETSCYINVVGDKLQSLEFENNFLTSVTKEGLPNIHIDIKNPKNINRRIKVENMASEINNLVYFKKYKLPIIECDDKIIKKNNIKPIKIIDTPKIYTDDVNNNEKVNNYCNIIMNNYIFEVETNNYLPEDFIIIFPIMAKNIIAGELQTKIQEYWTKKYNNINYIQYVYLHKHTEGSVINTKDSINSTRIMSIKSSKGDGRNVVFILGITESSLKLVSNKEKKLVYESHFHVALTRAKYQIYFGLLKNNDDIHKRFGETGYVEYLPEIRKNMNLEKLNQLIDKNKLIILLDKNNISPEIILKSSNTIQSKETIDWGYHCIKYQTFYYNIILNIINNRYNNLSKDNSQLFIKLKIISKYKIEKLNVNEYYKFLTKNQYKNLPYFPLCKLSNKQEYMKYSNIIEIAMKNVQISIKNNCIHKLSVYESIILSYMIEVETSQKYAEITPMDIYNITDFFQKNTNKEKELLSNIENVKNIINKSNIKQYQNINWNILKHIELNSKYNYFKINKLQFPIIGNNETDIIHIILESDISQINFWDIIIKILLERFLIYNPKSEEDNNKFKDKKINTYIFLLDKNSFIKFDWDWDKHLSNEIKLEIKNVLEEYYQNNHNNIYKYLTHIKDNENWNKEPNIIIEKLLDKLTSDVFPEYIIDFFKDIYTKIEDDEKYDYINNFKSFNNKLNHKLTKYIKKYLEIL